MSKAYGKGTKFHVKKARKDPFRAKRAPTNKTLNRKIKKINQHQELKHIDWNVLAAAGDITSGGLLIQEHNFVRIGDTAINRDGNWIHPTSLNISLRLSTKSSLIDAGTLYRCIIFWDRQCNGAVPTIYGATGLLDDTVIGVGTTPNMIAPRNHATLNRFKILYDRISVMNPSFRYTDTLAGAVTTTTTSFMQTVSFRKRVKLNRSMQYSSDAADITGVVSNAIYVLFLSEATNMTATGGVRMYFKDE